jgi:hypothetical protein
MPDRDHEPSAAPSPPDGTNVPPDPPPQRVDENELQRSMDEIAAAAKSIDKDAGGGESPGASKPDVPPAEDDDEIQSTLEQIEQANASTDDAAPLADDQDPAALAAQIEQLLSGEQSPQDAPGDDQHASIGTDAVDAGAEVTAVGPNAESEPGTNPETEAELEVESVAEPPDEFLDLDRLVPPEVPTEDAITNILESLESVERGESEAAAGRRSEVDETDDDRVVDLENHVVEMSMDEVSSDSVDDERPSSPALAEGETPEDPDVDAEQWSLDDQSAKDPAETASPPLDAAVSIGSAADAPPEPPAAAESAASVDDAPETQPTEAKLHGLDAQLAGNVDDLLESDFESVSSVLEGAFDETSLSSADGEDDDPESNEMLASLLQGAVFESYAEIVGEPEPPADSTEVESGQDSGDAAASTESAASDAEATAKPTGADAASTATREDRAETINRDESSASDAPDVAVDATEPEEPSAPREQDAGQVEASPETVARDALGEDPSRDTPTAPAAPAASQPQTPAPSSGRPTRAAVPAVEPSAGTVTDANEGDDDSETVESGSAKLLGVAVSILCAMNLPMRFVPPRLRPAVDWLALSLILWVPIVWLFAVFLASD